VSKWPMVPLGEILTKSEEWIMLHSDRKYKEVTVRLWGNGAVLRREVLGAEIASDRRLQVHAKQFIISRIDARNGASGLIPAGLEGAVVSSDFPVFTPDATTLEPTYLGWLSKTKDFVELCKAASEGTTNRVRLKEDRFLTMKIPLPQPEEQRRIVAKIDALAVKIEEARGLRDQAREGVDRFWEKALVEAFARLENEFPMTLFRDVCRVVRGGSPRPAGSPVYYEGDIPFLKVADLTRDEAKHVSTHIATIKKAGLSRTRWVEAGTLMLTNSGATLGVPKICLFGTTFNDGIQAFLDLPEHLNKDYLYYFLRSKTRWFREWAARGQGQPNLNTEMVRQMGFPNAPPESQSLVVEKLDCLRQRLNDLIDQQLLGANELKAMLPAILDRAFKAEL
jgi:type I restriction enzyme S subunit